MSVPHLFRCPISLDIFTDPVTLSTGQTYDRPCIERWLAAGHRTCPVTMQPLGDAALVPNRTLRRLIESWLSSGHQQLPEPARFTEAEEPSLAALKRCLQSGTGGSGKAAALQKVATLASESDVGRACMLQLGFLPVLLQLVFHAPTTTRLEEEELALHCALSLLPSDPASPQHDCLNVLRKEANLASFVRLLERGRAGAKAGLCRLLETIAAADATRALALVAAASPRVWQTLLPLLRHDDAHVSGSAARAVAAICATTEPARAGAVRHGAVGALFKFLARAPSSGKGDCGAASSALSAVVALAASDAGSRAVAREPGAVRSLVRHVFVMSSNNEGSEHAVAALLAVCRESRAAKSEAAAAGVVTQLLLLMQSQCGATAKNKARALLKLLRST